MRRRMVDQRQEFLFLAFVCFLLFPQTSWGWFFSFKETPAPGNPWNNEAISRDAVAEFSMEAMSNRKGVQLVENARKKMAVAASSSSCWQNAYENLFAGCSDILAAEEKRSRLAWHLSNCFQKDSGRPPFPYCDTKTSMVKCLTKLDQDAHRIYLEFYLETNSICHQLQTDAFKRQTERLVNELKKSAEFAEDKLEKIEERAEDLLQDSQHIHNSLASIDIQTQQVAEVTKNVEACASAALKHSEAVHKQTKEIVGSQWELQESQSQMKHKLEESMSTLHESYRNVAGEISKLKNEAAEIEKEIGRVGDAMDSKMNTLQGKADDIGNMAGISLDKQKKLLDGQSVAIEGLQFLTTFQSQALEESRGTLQKLAELGNKQQEELLQRQQLLQQAHDRLVENSRTILAAQEAFESKQASMFVALDKLFTLHNAMLLESRLVKMFIIYSMLIFVLYLFTSTKQTYAVRPRLYIGLCATFLIEFVILRHGPSNIEQQAWVLSLVRSLFALIAAIQLLYAVCTFRDIELLNHQLLLKITEDLMEVFNGKRAKYEELSWGAGSDINWPSWVETELPEDVDNLEDPDYLFPEEVGENSVPTTSTTKRYNLRRRHNS